MRIVHRRAFMTAITQWSQARAQPQSRCAILQNADWLITPDANYILLALALAPARLRCERTLISISFVPAVRNLEPGKLFDLYFLHCTVGEAYDGDFKLSL